MKPIIAPSILSANFAHLATDIHRISNAEWVHVDVMDNHFVPNLTLGPPVVKSIAASTSTPLDCHLMIENPRWWAPQYAEFGATNITFHAEATDTPVAVARDIRAAGALAGLALKPGTPFEEYTEILPEVDTLLIMTVEPGFGGQAFIREMLPKIRAARRSIDAGHLSIRLEVDGGIDENTIIDAAEAGADAFVAGSAVYGSEDPAQTVDYLRALAEKHTPGVHHH